MLRSLEALRGGRRAVCSILRWREVSAPSASRSLSQIASVTKSPVAARPALLFSHLNVRDFADPPKQAELPPPPLRVKLPKLVPGVPGKYASAFYIVSVRSGAVDQVESEVQEIATRIAQMPDFAKFAENTFIEKKDRIEIIKELFFSSMHLHSLTKNFLTTLAEDGQLRIFGQIAKAFAELMDAHRGYIRTIITTADDISNSDLEYIKKNVVSKLLEPGQTPNIVMKINEDLIGGCVVEVGDKLLDMSISRRIQQIEKVLLEALD